VNAATSDPYFCDHKGNIKEKFCHQKKWNNSMKMRKKKMKTMTNNMKI